MTKASTIPAYETAVSRRWQSGTLLTSSRWKAPYVVYAIRDGVATFRTPCGHYREMKRLPRDVREWRPA